jgi:hypothetical protein
MRFLAVLSITGLAACSPSRTPVAKATDSTAPAFSAIPTLPKVGPVDVDSGPPVRFDRTAAGVRLVMDPAPGDQINALQPPVLQTTDGRRLAFRGSTVTSDSAYFTGDVTLDLAAAVLPLEGTLLTSYCRAGEKLCRTAKRAVRVGE